MGNRYREFENDSFFFLMPEARCLSFTIISATWQRFQQTMSPAGECNRSAGKPAMCVNVPGMREGCKESRHIFNS
jgi:hypothetical protein